MNSFDHYVYYYRARFFELMKKPHDAARDYRKTLALKPDFAPALIALGVLYASIQQYPSAEDCLGKLLHLDPDNANWLFDLAFVYEKQRRFDDAIRLFERSVAINSKLDRAWYGMGLSYAAKGDHAAAAKSFEKATKLQPWAPYPWYQLAMAHYALDNMNKVKEILRHVSTFDPKVTEQLERDTGLRIADLDR